MTTCASRFTQTETLLSMDITLSPLWISRCPPEEQKIFVEKREKESEIRRAEVEDIIHEVIEKALAKEKRKEEETKAANTFAFPSESEAKASWEKQLAGLQDRESRGVYRVGDSRLTDGPCPWWN